MPLVDVTILCSFSYSSKSFDHLEMNCFSCFGSHKSRKLLNKKDHISSSSRPPNESKLPETKKQKPGDGSKKGNTNGNIATETFTFRELATATRNFRQECLLGEGGFGRVYKGTLPSNGQVVAVKQLDRNGLQGNKEFLVEVLTLSLVHHPNLVNLVGYCADGDQRLLVYEFMSKGSLEDHLLDISLERTPIDWYTRMRIAFGAAKGLEYLHDKANPPVIYRDLKPSNILLDENLTPKLSDFGLVKLGPSGDSMHVSSRVMGTYGYCAPEYARGGELTLKSDVYSFGVILLELITGRRAVDTTKPMDEQNLVAWAQPIFRNPKRFTNMADPLLDSQFPEKDLNQVVAIAAMCLQEEAAARPLMSDVVTALSFLSMSKDDVPWPASPPTPPSDEKLVNHGQEKNEAVNSSVNQSHQNQDRIKGHDRDISDYQDTIISSSYRISKRLHEYNVSPRMKNSSMSHNGSASSSEDSTRGSHGRRTLSSWKNSKRSQNGDGNSSRRSSMGSYHETEYLSYKSSRKSHTGSSSFDNNSN